MGINVKRLIFSINQTMPEDFLASVFLFQFQAKGHLFDMPIEPAAHLWGDFFRCQHHADLGIVDNGPGVEIQRADEDFFKEKR